MMSSFGYRPNDNIISEGSGTKIAGNSRIAKLSSLTPTTAVANEKHSVRSFRNASDKSTRKDDENNAVVKVVTDSINCNNAMKISNKSVSSSRRGDAGGKEAVESVNTSSKAKADVKGYSVDKSSVIAGEGSEKKQQIGVSKIARIDRMSGGRSSNHYHGKKGSKISSTVDQSGSEKNEVCEDGSVSGLRKPVAFSLPKDQDSQRSPDNKLETITKRTLQSFPTEDGDTASGKMNSKGNLNEAVKASVTDRNPLQSKISTKATVKYREDPCETIGNCILDKKPMQGSTSNKSIVKGIPVLNKSECFDSKVIHKASDKPSIGKPNGVLKSNAAKTSAIVKPKEVSASTNSSFQEKPKAGVDWHGGESTASVLTSKSVEAVVENNACSVSRKTEYLRYNEKEEIKPRALVGTNKGRVARAAMQKPRQKIIKEGVIAKRTGQGNKPVDCNLQKKQFRESKSKSSVPEAKDDFYGGEKRDNEIVICAVTSNKAGKIPRAEKESIGTENERSLENAGFSVNGVREQKFPLKDDVERKDRKKVTFDEKATNVDALCRTHGRKKGKDYEEVELDEKEAKHRENSGAQFIGKSFENDTDRIGNETTFNAERNSQNASSFSENDDRKTSGSNLVDSRKPETKVQLTEDNGNYKRHVVKVDAKQQERGMKFVDCNTRSGVLCAEDQNNVKPFRSAHVLIDEIVYKNKNTLCPREGALQTFSDQDLRATVEESKDVREAGRNGLYRSGSLDRNELRNRDKMKMRQTGNKEVLTMKSQSDPKLTNEIKRQGLSEFGKEDNSRENNEKIGVKAIQSIPITEPVIRESTRGTKKFGFIGKDVSTCESNMVSREAILTNHVKTEPRVIIASKPSANTIALPADSVGRQKEIDRRCHKAGVQQEVIGNFGIFQGNIKSANMKLHDVISEVNERTLKTGRTDDKSWIGPRDPRNWNQDSHDLTGSNEWSTRVVDAKDGGSLSGTGDQVSNFTVHETNGMDSSKDIGSISEGLSTQSVHKAAVPPMPPKRTVTKYQRDYLKTNQDYESNSKNTSNSGLYNSPPNGLANGISGNKSSGSLIGQINHISNSCVTTTNWPWTNNETVYVNSMLPGNEQQGHWVEPHHCSKTNNISINIEEKNDNKHLGKSTVGFPSEGKMGQNNVVVARPKMPPRDDNVSTFGDRQMSPIIEESRAEKRGHFPPNFDVNEMLLKQGCGTEKSNFMQTSRDATQAHVDSVQSMAVRRTQPQGEGTRCKSVKSNKSHTDKPKQNNFISSLVRMLQEGRDEDKIKSTEAINSYDKTVLVDMHGYEHCDPIGLTDDSYLIDEEDPFYQFSLQQGLHDKHARYPQVYDASNFHQRSNSHEERIRRNDSHSSHDGMKKTNDIHVDHDGNAKHGTTLNGSSIGSPGNITTKEVKFLEKPMMSSSMDKPTESGSSFELKHKYESSGVCLMPTKLPTNTSQDFITISGHKVSPLQGQPRLCSFSGANAFTKSTDTDNVNRSRTSEQVNGIGNTIEIDGKSKINRTMSLQEDRTAEVRENVRKLAELNVLKNSLKVAQTSGKSGKKSSSKRKTKKANDHWWESGQRAIFYSDTDNLCANADLELGSLTKKTKYDKGVSYKYNDVDLPEVGNHCSVISKSFKTDVKRNEMDSEGDEILTTSPKNYYKSVVKHGKNENTGDQVSKADFIEHKSTVEGFKFTNVDMNGVTSPKSKPSAKVKPYTVVDLSTMSALTPEEVDSCLKEASDAENRIWTKGDCSVDIDHEEAPRTLVLPPKGSRNRCNTTAGTTKNEERGGISENNGDMQGFSALKIVSSSDYSQPGSSVTELSSFRARSKTLPAFSDQLKNTAKDHKKTSFGNQQSCDQDQSNVICISPTKRKGVGSDHCDTVLDVSKVPSQSPGIMSQEFPPPPSEEELGEKETEREATPEWPAIPDSVDSIGSQSLKNVFLGTEHTAKATDFKETIPDVKESDANKSVKTCDPHRSLPPIPGGACSVVSVAPLAWVSRATPHGTGPFIPMCQSTEDIDDLMKSHFYDDIDQIRKVAQERAMMIKRLEEEEARIHCPDHTVGKVEGRNSLGDMPDLIPSTDDCKTVEGGKCVTAGHVVGMNVEQTRLNSKNPKGLSTSAACSSDVQSQKASVENLHVTTFDKKSKSKFTRLFKKISGQKSVELIDYKPNTPQPPRKETFTSKREADRNEIFATPATNRRLFSLSKNRPQRQRSTSETEAMTSDCRDTDEFKRGKNRTVSFGFRRKKARRDMKKLYKDDRNLQSLEALKISSDVSSDSGSSTRLSPVNSPLMSDKETYMKKYRAPEPPRSLNISEDECLSLRSDFSDKSNDNLTKDDRQMRNTACGTQLNHNEHFLNEVKDKVGLVKPSEISHQRNRIVDENAELSGAEKVSTGERNDDVFLHEGAYDNYPPSKIHSERPAKPPRSESEDKDFSQTTGNKPPEKPLRRSRDHGVPIKPEPYSSQRSYRKITDQHIGTGEQLSPASISEDESNGIRDYQVPFDYIGYDRDRWCKAEPNDWESKTVKSSASDFCLSGHLRRGNMFYHSDRSMERPSQFRRRGSYSSEVVGDSYYENLRGTSGDHEDFLDSYDKLLEIHQDTVRQISDATVFKCDCKELRDTDWNDFEIRGKMLNYGISSYVTVPVAVKRSGKRMDEKYTAWLRQSFGFLQSCGDSDLEYSVCDVTMHENLLHICQDIRQNGNNDEENSDEVPHDIRVKRMLVSKVTPKMSLAKYLALTMDKHSKDPDSYEKEACLIILQILKGLGHLGQHGLMVDSIDSESVLLNDIHRGVLSPNFSNNNNNNEVLGCPIAMYLALPGLLKRSREVRGQANGESSDIGSKAEGGINTVSENDKTILEAEDQVADSDGKNTKCEVTTSAKLDKEHSRELISLIFDVFHASHLLDDGLEEDGKSISEVPMLPVKSVYSDRLQRVIDKLFHKEAIGVEELIRELQVISFCPCSMEKIEREELLILLRKWRNRRCVDMVTDILKKYSLISLASGLASGGTNSMGLARNCVLECQFLSNVTSQEIANIMCG